MDKHSAIAIGVTAGLGVGYLLGKAYPNALRVEKDDTKLKKSAKDLDEVERLIRPNILALTPYRCARDDYDQGTSRISTGILLDANENSLGPPLSGHEQLQKMQLERYPCPYQLELKKAITDYRNQNATEKISQANTFLGVGSDEAIDLIIRVACTPRVDNILITPPTYGLPLPSFHINPQEILNAVTASTKVIFLCSPGNPTANVLRCRDIETILESEKYKGFVVADEAYIDFADTSSLCTLVNKHKRLIVLQTLSKGFGLAGIRLGIAFGDPKLIQVLNNVKAPYNISKLTSDVARKAFSNLEELHKSVALIKESCEVSNVRPRQLQEKHRVIAELQKLSFVRRIYASDSNFVLFEIPQALAVYREMASRGVVIRYRGNQHLLTGCVRATIGSRSENDRMLELLVEVSGDQ
uniref:histidinol-phosphate transaminase n=1 Tax=Hyaloperonospora arabidopsidis (strain Emoy2) TaxID=559515 RepID=M4B6L4_HYAAE